ncbi:hypothetical protein MBT84_39940 [Streptomyces sp. MBT84]|uniref:hypothetical protein n=1 Tax=Streptomyces sp. MBT84 TaxID=1488414 RepID=UPI001DF7F39F|nr:hypothetical protein [Streptomyces sp. MBT84]MBW8705800.1 hypothetical protein [Streptomyces sp. MBT84]
MRLTVSVRDPQVEGVSTTVAVETEPSAQAGSFAAELARAVGYAGATEGEPPLYVGSSPLDPHTTLQVAGVRDGMDLGLGAPLPREPEPEGRTEVRLVSGPGAGTVFRLVPGDYDIGSGPTCRIRLAEGAPTLAARARVCLDGSAELLMTETALLDGKSTQGPARGGRAASSPWATSCWS